MKLKPTHRSQAYNAMSFPAGALKLVEVPKESKAVELAIVDSSFSIEVHPREADVFIGYSTTQGQTAVIDREDGTIFFQVYELEMVVMEISL